MTEKLKGIKDKDWDSYLGYYNHEPNEKDINWLIEQAEKVDKQEQVLKELQWKLKNVRAFDAEEVIYESIVIVDKALKGE